MRKTKRGPLTANAELDALARKFGFTDGMDLSLCLYRVGIGVMQVGMAKHTAELDENPNLTPQAKKVMQDQMQA